MATLSDAGGAPPPPALRALPTIYDGITFRSRSEARWAVFFDTLGVRWQYEPEGYALPAGNYLPDFWLPDLECFYEVKGQYPTDNEWEKACYLAEMSGHLVFIAFHPMPKFSELTSSGVKGESIVVAGPLEDAYRSGERPHAWGDYGYQWAVCRLCGLVAITYAARGERIDCGCHHPGKDYSGDHPRIAEAYTNARTYRSWTPRG